MRFGSGRTNWTITSAISEIPPAASHGTVSAPASTSLPANIGLKTVGPRIAPKTEPKSTYEIPRARRAGGYMSPAAVRMSSATALAAPIIPKPAITAKVESVRVASAVNAQPAAPTTKPKLITGVRPNLSIIRPAGTEVRADAVRKIAGPSPSSPRTPVTRTKVSEDTAATNCRTAEFTAIVAARRTVFRRIGSAGAGWLTTGSFNQYWFNGLREARGDRRPARRRARRLRVVRSAADHHRRGAHVSARGFSSAIRGRETAARHLQDRPAVRRRTDPLPHGERSAHGCSPDHRPQRPGRDHPQASEAECRR